MICTNIIQAQLVESMTKKSFLYVHSDSASFIQIKFDQKKFEFIIDNLHDCTPAYLYYGKGSYEIKDDSIQLFFDSIPTLNSISKLDSIPNEDKMLNIQIEINDQNGMDINDLTLVWGIQKKRAWARMKSFNEQFSKGIKLILKPNQKLSYLRVQKGGYYRADIALPQRFNQDYFVKVTMNPKPQVESSQYFSNTEITLKIVSTSEIQLDGAILKQEHSY